MEKEAVNTVEVETTERRINLDEVKVSDAIPKNTETKVKVEMKDKSFKQRFVELKAELFVGKGVKNTFAGFNYRTRPQIYEATRPLELKYFISIDTTSELLSIEGRLHIKGIAIAEDVLSDETKVATSFAEIQAKAGTKMSEPQLTGSSETYAVKNALLNLLGLTDNEVIDPDQEEQETRVGVKAQELISQKQTVGNKGVQDVASFKSELLSIDNSTITLEVINGLLERADTIGADDATYLMINTKGKHSGKPIKFNQTTNRWEE